jgi:hypothetical protein
LKNFVLPKAYAYFCSPIDFLVGKYDYIKTSDKTFAFTVCVCSYDGQIPAIPRTRLNGDEIFLGFYPPSSIVLKDKIECENFETSLN